MSGYPICCELAASATMANFQKEDPMLLDCPTNRQRSLGIADGQTLKVLPQSSNNL
jgi:hypothetical protein